MLDRTHNNIIEEVRSKGKGEFIQMDRDGDGGSEQGLINIIMTKRSLPLRATRGQLPAYLRQPASPPKKERSLTQQETLDTERKDIENRRRSQQLINLRKYPFCRALHYFFDLDSFPRTPGHLSYALDHSNALNNTYSKDQKQLKTLSYGQVLNRRLFGLPISSGSGLGVKKESRTKNVCFGYLFEIEDKKHQNDRVIYTLKVVLRKLKQGSTQSLLKLDVLRKDPELETVLDPDVHLKEKVRVVEERLQLLENRKEVNWTSWEPDDRLYFYHSLNQRLHNQILDLRQGLSQEHLISNLFPNAPTRARTKAPTLYYYSTNERAVTSSVKIKSTLPVSVMHFRGCLRTMKTASQVVAKKCESLGETSYYEVRQMVKKLFGFELSLRPEKTQTYPNYQKAFRKKCEDIKRGPQTPLQKMHPPCLDRFTSHGLLSLKHKATITGKEYHLVLIFYWLCSGLFQLTPVLEQSPDLLALISSDYFVKVYSYLVEATGSPLVGAMCAAIESLGDIFSKPDPLICVPVRLCFEFEPSVGVGVLVREDVDCLEEEKINPSKRVKRDGV